MHKTSHLAVVAAILLIALFPINADADWINEFSYEVTVSNSAGGPFTPNVKLWSSKVPAGFESSYVDIFGESKPVGFEDNGVFYHSLGNYDKDTSGIPDVPFFQKLTIHDKSNGLSGSLMFGGMWKFPLSPLEPIPDLTEYAEGQIGDQLYKATFMAIPLPMGSGERGPDSTFWAVAGVEFFATIERTEVAPTPEPTTLLLALPAAFVLGAGSIRKRWFQA